ncbi:MAG: hypothetical protein AABY86_16160 [Bdellovibrionota bacterium]
MGRICILWFVLFWLFNPSTHATHGSEVKGFTYFLSGRDGAGHTLFDRFELYPNGKASWQIASKGDVCPAEGGVFQGNLNEQTRKKVLELVKELYEHEKMSKGTETKEGDTARRARHLFQIEFENAVFSIELHKAFKDSQAFFQELAFIKAKTQPQRALRMMASKEKNAKGKKGRSLGLIISFLNIGSDPFRLLLPKNPNEVFFLNTGEKISYRRPPIKRDLLLSKGETVDLILDIVGKIQGPIYYDSGVMAHHALLNLKKDLPPVMEVFLCAGESL